MRRVALRGAAGGLRARRWDAVVLGSAPPGLFAAARLGTLGLRVLVVEEDGPLSEAPLLAEPFFASCASGAPIDEALKAVGITPVDRRGLEIGGTAYQVLLDDARIDVGSGALLADEWVAYGLAKPEEARELTREIESAARAEAEALLASPVVRSASRRALSRPARGGVRGLPAALLDRGSALRPFVEAQVEAQALSLGGTTPEATARLLGAPLFGGACFDRPGVTLLRLLRQRIERVHGEFRTLGGSFELVEVGGHPGIAPQTGGEAWLGRVLLINTPLGVLAGAFRNWEQPGTKFVKGEIPSERTVSVLLRGPREIFPEALTRRAILATSACDSAVALSLFPCERSPGLVDLVARSRAPADPEGTARRADEVEAAVRGLLTFADERLVRVASSDVPQWDDPTALYEPFPGQRWPCDVDLRLAARLPVHALSRSATACLGIEGDALLGWRAADALAPSP